MKQSSFSRYCEYRSNRDKYELITSIPAAAIAITLASVILKWFLILLLCYAVGTFIYYLVKEIVGQRKGRKTAATFAKKA